MFVLEFTVSPKFLVELGGRNKRPYVWVEADLVLCDGINERRYQSVEAVEYSLVGGVRRSIPPVSPLQSA